MDLNALEQLLAAYKRDELETREAARRISELHYEDIGYARVDHSRSSRQGFPEVVFGAGKTREQVVGIVERLIRHSPNVLVTHTDAGTINRWLGLSGDSRLIHLHRLDNVAARPASGSHPQEGMVIVPCSMGTLGAIASGAGTNLIHRAADVTLKESRRLVIVPRETPYNAIHLENMLRLSHAGAHIVPASPGFYHRPQTIEALVDHLVFRILDHLGVPHSRSTQWRGLRDQPGELMSARED